MAQFDLPLAELEQYRPEIAEPADFDDFWAATLAEARTHGGGLELGEKALSLPQVDVWDATFPGYAGQPVRAWYARPAGVTDDLPTVIHYVGYGGGRGLPVEHTFWPSAGFAYLVMDTRGQGTAWGSGGAATPDFEGSDPAYPGFTTKGILAPETYYYRRVFADAARAIDAVRGLDGVDAGSVAVHGGSQGGAIALAAAALVPDVTAACIDVPFLCHVARACAITDQHPYQEIVRYLAVHHGHEDQVWRTLSYVDGASFATRAHARSIWSVALMDAICPPSTVYAAYHRYAGEREMVVYPYNGHEGGGAFQVQRQWEFLAPMLGA